MLDQLSLKENCDYANGEGRVEIYHQPSKDWFPLLETRNKTVIYEDGNGNRRNAKVEKISEVNFPDGTPNPISLEKQQSEPQKTDLFEGLIFSNTNYEGQNVYVEHENKGHLKLVRTSNKVLFVKENGEVKRMTLSKLVGVSGLEQEEENQEEQEQEQEEEVAV